MLELGVADIPLTWNIFDCLPVRPTFRFTPTRPNGRCTFSSKAEAAFGALSPRLPPKRAKASSSGPAKRTRFSTRARNDLCYLVVADHSLADVVTYPDTGK